MTVLINWEWCVGISQHCLQVSKVDVGNTVDERRIWLRAHIMAHIEASWNNCVALMDHPPIFLIDQLQSDGVTTIFA
ncbi:hypothetical protein LINGRAHAP2_LOCUS12946 [Linum grandiflorum]